MSKKENKSGSLKKRINYGTGYILLVVAIIVVFVVTNIILEQLPMSLDFTTNKTFSITETTKQLLNTLDEDIEIIALYDKVRADEYQSEVIKILDIYDTNDHIDVSYISLNDNPNIIYDSVGETYADLYAEGDYIVKSAKRSKRISGVDMFEIYEDKQNLQVYVTGNIAERRLSTAIKYVTLDSIPNLYVSTGLQEKSMREYSTIFDDVDNASINIKEIDLSKIDKIPEDAGLITFLSPKKDLTQKEFEMLHHWLSFDAGMLIVAFDSDSASMEMTNFNLLLSNLYGMKINNDIVSDEEDYQITVAAKPTVIYAQDLQKGPLEYMPLKDSFISFDSRSIDILNTTGYFETHPLIQTSKTAKSTEYITGKENIGVATLVACGEYYENNKHSKVVVFGSSLGLTDEYIKKYNNATSRNLFFYSVNWMIGEEALGSLDIETRDYSTTYVLVDKTQSKWIFTFSVIIYPLIIIGFGVFVWARRRHL